MANEQIISENISFVGVKNLNLEEKKVVNTLSSQYLEKLKRLVQNDVNLQLMVKTYAKTGSRKKYSINLKLLTQSHSLVADKGAEWTLNAALHSSFRSLLQEVKNKLRV